MLWKTSRADRPVRLTLRTVGRGKALGSGASLLLVIGLLFLAGACGQDVQTNQPYTPAEGINVDVAPGDPNTVVNVRNLLIISWAPGEGVVSGTIVTAGRDALTGVTGVPIKADGTEGAPFTGTIPSTVSIANGFQVVLTDQPPIVVTSPDIIAGLEADLTLQFENAGEVTVRVPIVDGNESQYATLRPSPSPTPSA